MILQRQAFKIVERIYVEPIIPTWMTEGIIGYNNEISCEFV